MTTLPLLSCRADKKHDHTPVSTHRQPPQVLKGANAALPFNTLSDSVFPWLTVQENLMFGLNGHAHLHKAGLADHYAHIVGLKGFETSYPRELPGGMLKRAELARALVVKPESSAWTSRSQRSMPS